MSARHRLARSGACAYCERPVFPAGSPEVRADPTCQATKDHVLPQIWHDSGNGVRSVANSVTACVGCNGVKGHYPEEPFRFFLAETRGTPRFNHAEFRRLIFGLALAGFKAAYRDAASRMSPPTPLAAVRGRYTAKDLRRGR